MSAIPPVSRRRRFNQEGGIGGVLAVIFWCACGIVAVPLAGMFSLIAALGTTGAFSAMADSIAGPTVAAQMLRLGLVPQAVLFVWGAAFVGLTVMRSRHALTVAPLLLIVWLAVSTFCQFSIRSLMVQENATIMDFAALMPAVLAQAIGVAALVGYFKEGTRPKAYYTR
ncbi:hypothetical protein ACLBXM_14830 [Xanthobacteraceae bacterium A53D]